MNPLPGTPKLRVPLEPDLPSEQALRRILLVLLAAIRANVGGVLGDLDPEHLHDLRVAVRRSRAALSRLRGILPRSELLPFRHDLKWLGTVTGPSRDLDVLAAELAAFRETTDPRLVAGLAPVEDAVDARRHQAREPLEAALASSRAQRFITDWQRYLESSTPAELRPERALMPVQDLANGRIFKTFFRVADLGKEMGRAPAAADLHRLRIETKKLRYLLEFFRTLYPARRIERRIQGLKRLQDVLGGIQDCTVQDRQVTRILGSLEHDGVLSPVSNEATHRLLEHLRSRQNELRASFHDRFRSFVAARSLASYRTLTGRQEKEPEM